MMHPYKTLSVIALAMLSLQGISQKAIFLHHSTGDNVYFDGDVPEWISDYNDQHGKNYVVDERTYPNDPYTWDNYPYDYWNLWLNGACDNGDPDIECLSGLCNDYDVIIFKHCYPGSGILPDTPTPSVSSSKKTLANYKLQYRALRDLLDTYPDNKFIVWTLAPLHRLTTDSAETSRARTFVDWVKGEWLSEDGKEHPNIYIFDFFGLVAEQDSTPENGTVNCLKYEFEISHDDDNSHPNLAANEFVAPLFGQFIVDVMEDTNLPSGVGEDLPEDCRVIMDGDLLRISRGGIRHFEKVTVYNLLGNPVFTSTLYADESDFNTGQWAKGVYLVHLATAAGRSQVLKVCKK